MLAFNIEKALLGQSLKHGRCEMMSDGGEATDSIHADWKGSPCVCVFKRNKLSKTEQFENLGSIFY